MRGVLLDWRCGLVRVGGFGAGQVDLAVGGAGEDVSATEGGEGYGVDGPSVGGDRVDSVAREGCGAHRGETRCWLALGQATVTSITPTVRGADAFLDLPLS